MRIVSVAINPCLCHTTSMPEDTFESWLEKVNTVLFRLVGLGHEDIEDQPWWDWWDDGYSPYSAAQEAIENIGY